VGHLEPESSLRQIPELRWLRETIIERALTKGDYVLSGGARSDYYIDKFRLFSDPKTLRRIARLFTPVVADFAPDLIAGAELGGVILATAVSQMTSLPMIVVRKQAKSYGAFANDFVEGPVSRGQRVLLLEDVVTNGREVSARATGPDGNGACRGQPRPCTGEVARSVAAAARGCRLRELARRLPQSRLWSSAIRISPSYALRASL
jgi:orotate phosphoribosyltransferase